MRSWRLSWALREVSNFSNFRKHNKILVSPWRFYFSIMAKFLPNIWKLPITLKLKQGRAFEVHEFMTLYIYKEIFVDKCYDFPPLPANNPVIIDVGANTGLFTIRMKQMYPNSHIYCFEPFSSNYDQLKRNLEISQFKDVNIFNKGIGGTARKEKLFIHSKNIGGHSLYQEASSSEKYIEIDLIEIRNILNMLEGKNCDLLKLDCEGAEHEIIKSMSDEVATRVKRIIFEPSPSLYDLNELIQHLANIGYRVERNKGLYVAFFESN